MEGYPMKQRIERIKKELHSKGYKLTPQREATLTVLLERESDHLSAEEIFLLVKDKAPEIGLATVYRTLELLSDLSVLDKINFGDGVSRYDLRKEGVDHFHHRLVCMECGQVEEVMGDLVNDVEKIIEDEWQFKGKDHRLTFHGVCKQGQEAGAKVKVNEQTKSSIN